MRHRTAPALALALATATAALPGAGRAQGTVAGAEGARDGGDAVIAIAVHGGAGRISREIVTPERAAAYAAALEEAVRAGYAILQRGGPALDAVVEAVRLLEDSPLFNAGRGSAFTAAGTQEMDASVMDGRDRSAGAVAAVRRVRNPILLARAVMERSPHVLLVGEGAEAFAEEQGIELVDPSYFFSRERWEALERELARRAGGETRPGGGPDPGASVSVGGARRERGPEPGGGACGASPDDGKYGTVGAVALDRDGNLAAATSTGGMTGKRVGRVGDSPIIGAGTYAENGICAVSATGHGEYFIRNVVAHDICALARYTGIPVAEAAERVVMERLVAHGGEGGVIAIDAEGRIAMPFNTEGMFRAAIDAAGNVTVAMFRD